MINLTLPHFEPCAKYDETIQIFVEVRDNSLTTITLPLMDKSRYYYVSQHDLSLKGTEYLKLDLLTSLKEKEVIKLLRHSFVTFTRECYRTFLNVHTGISRKLTKAGIKVSCQDHIGEPDKSMSKFKLQNKKILRFPLCKLSCAQTAPALLNGLLENVKSQVGEEKIVHVHAKTSNGPVHVLQ